MDYRLIVAVIVVVLSFAAYIPYIQDIHKGKTTPHAFTWLAASITAGVAFALQTYGGGGVGAWPMFIITVICVYVFVLSIFKGTKDIKLVDYVCLALSLLAIYLWVVVEQPLISVFMITIGEIFGFIPTIRKAWHAPHSETAALYEISAVRHSLSILALEKINLLTALYPATWALMCILITLELHIRRKN